MKCLHLCNGLLDSKVHENLYARLGHHGLCQQVYYFVRDPEKDNYDKELGFSPIPSKPIKKYHKLFFRNKIRYLFKDLSEKTDLDQLDLVQATTLFSDGALALEIHKRHGTPYVVAIRGGDVYAFFRLRIDLWPLAGEILEKASGIVFISKILERNFFDLFYVRNFQNERQLRAKSRVIFNGIDPFWLDHKRPMRDLKPSKVLYIGNLSENKNVERLAQAVLMLRTKYPEMQLDIVGKGGGQETTVVQLSKEHAGIINFHGPIYDFEKLRERYAEAHIFAMVSLGETFGLVYVEALSQGLPVVCTRGQGIDGSFRPRVGEFVDSLSVESIAEGLEKVMRNYTHYELDHLDFTQFEWSRIADQYMDFYREIIA